MRWFTADFTTREANLIFVWSRMRTVDEEDKAARERLTQLSFEDFLEAVCRLSGTRVAARR